MRFFADAKVLRGSISWTNPLRFKISVLPRPAPRNQEVRAEVPAEYDEDGRIWVFRFAPARAQAYAMDRNRIFTYMRTHRLPTEGVRQLRRDLRNTIDLYSGVRELQTHPEIRAHR